MTPKEYVPLAPFTTLGVGGAARFFIEARSEKDINEAIRFSRERTFPLFALGEGSNVLVPDAGVEGVVLKMEIQDMNVADHGTSIVMRAGAGTRWDNVVDEMGECGVFGVENLAGIPGSLGGAAVQNIGAYGAELSTVFEHADTVHRVTGERVRISRADAAFAYRTSFFKTHPELLISHVTLRLKKGGRPNIRYPDVARAHSAGTPLSTPIEVARTIRTIRAHKFPNPSDGGTAGSFFKNPIVPREFARALSKRFPDLPVFSQGDGTVKVSLAWLLDHVLHLKGFSMGNSRLYERHSLLLVARVGATAAEIDSLAHTIATRVLKETGINIEREVENFGA